MQEKGPRKLLPHLWSTKPKKKQLECNQQRTGTPNDQQRIDDAPRAIDDRSGESKGKLGFLGWLIVELLNWLIAVLG